MFGIIPGYGPDTMILIIENSLELVGLDIPSEVLILCKHGTFKEQLLIDILRHTATPTPILLVRTEHTVVEQRLGRLLIHEFFT